MKIISLEEFKQLYPEIIDDLVDQIINQPSDEYLEQQITKGNE
jgi:hypothetical protein